MSQDRDDLEALLVYAAARLLGRGAEHGLTVRALTSRCELSVNASADEVARSSALSHQLFHAGGQAALLDLALAVMFSHDELLLLRALGDEELTGQALARRCDLELDPRLKILLANLVDQGVLLSGRNGYRLASPAVAELVHRCTNRLPSE